ncbi:hypothetical protein PIB30_064316 [Stylosanthes scabra]|uniref:Uncharacterized protein n=1 Tax=Stylosanthes scabra TaxID=79078 RepID=A0ABU6SLS0_9FABA|nr:hypothetical protein [Stylosanthes scabra]
MEKEKKKHSEDQNTSTKFGVVITIYVESQRSRSTKLSKDLNNNNNNKKTKAQPLFKVPHDARKKGYDRRAQILAYSRQLRNQKKNDKVDQENDNEKVKIKLSSKASFLISSLMTGTTFTFFLKLEENKTPSTSINEFDRYDYGAFLGPEKDWAVIKRVKQGISIMDLGLLGPISRTDCQNSGRRIFRAFRVVGLPQVSCPSSLRHCLPVRMFVSYCGTSFRRGVAL